LGQDKNQLCQFSIQPKLTVGAPDDPYEMEADAVADKVMRMPDSGFIQRKCAHCESEEKINHKTISNSITPFIQTKSDKDASASNSISNKINSSRGNGTGLDISTLSFINSRFGSNFSNVKIHTDGEAVQLNRHLNARAFTVGNDIYFNQGQYNPGSSEGKHLLAHELTHVAQQGGAQALIQREQDPKEETLKEKLKRGETLSEDELEYLKSRLGKEIVQQILGQTGGIRITLGGQAKEGDLNRKFRGQLDLRLSGPMAIGKSYEGTATTDIDLSIKAETGKGLITLSPPTERNKLAATIRQLLFPNNSPMSYDFDFPKDKLKYANAIDLLGSFSISISAFKSKATGGMFQIHHESVPSGVELIVTLSSTSRTTSVADTKFDLPSDHWILTPNPRIFGTIGYGKSLGNDAFTSTLGADFPLLYDSKTPLIYGGLGVRGSLDSNKFGRAGGTAFVGLNFDPLSLQMGIGTGAAFLANPIMTKDGPAQTVVYHELEGMAAYRILPNMELLLLLSVGGGKDLPAYGTAQLGAGYRF
jgi:hypothetical protein